MNSISPVLTEADVQHEHVIALDQKECLPLIVLPVIAECLQGSPIATVVRFEFTAKERQKIANGADLVLMELTFGGPFTPISIALAMPNSIPEGW